ncbi:MAG: GntR family transcriptional regulator [Clostridia bacterium]|nr:GntR family transcriptional regulator [Clostridia bacterium]
MIQLDYKSGQSICEQVVNRFIQLKALGLMKGGDQLPSVRALASQLSVNPNTVQKAYAILENAGIIYSVKGKGSFLSDDERAHDAVRQKAETDFTAAVRTAKSLGLSQEDLVTLVLKEETT